MRVYFYNARWVRISHSLQTDLRPDINYVIAKVRTINVFARIIRTASPNNFQSVIPLLTFCSGKPEHRGALRDIRFG